MTQVISSELRLRLSCLLRKAGLGRVPMPVLVCMCAGLVLLLGLSLWHFWPGGGADAAGEDFAIETTHSDHNQEANANAGGGSTEGAAKIAVDVEGAVKKPGLYRLDANARIDDAVAAAGGFKKSAARGEVNLAQALSDGQQVLIPFKSSGQASASPADGEAGTASAAAQSRDSNGKININTASAEELQKLSGVGESISARIIDYREKNGAFKSVDDLTNVSGIGDARLEAVRDQICV